MAIALNRSRQVPADETPAFGGIAERFRRAGDLERAVALCRDGLKKFPDHLSARVTLGWSLLDLGRYDEAQVELEQVLKRAPDNLAAIRGLAELHERAENAVVVPIEEHEAAEAAAALEAANAIETEKAPAAPAAEPAKRAKAQPPASAPEPPPTKAKAETHVEPEPPRAAPAPKHHATGPSVFAQQMLARESAKSEPKAAKAEPKAAAIEAKPTAEPTRAAESKPVAETKPAKAQAKPAPPSLESLAAEFEAPAEPFTVEPPKPEPAAVIEPVRVLDNRGEEVPDLTRAAVSARADVAPAPAATTIPNLVDELVTPAAAAMSQPAEVIDDFIPPPASALTTPEPVVDDAPLADLPVMDFAADADALLSSDALLSAAESDPAATAQIHPAEPEPTHAELVEAPAPASHPEPDVNELLAQLAQEEDNASQSASMFAEPAASIEAYPQPDVADVAAPFAQEPAAESAHTSTFATEAFAAASEFHPEPQIADVAAPPLAAPAAAIEPDPAWPSATPDFVAALEATEIEPVAPPVPEPAGPVFALSAEPPAPVAAADFALKSEPLAIVEAAADQPSMLEHAQPKAEKPAAKLGTAQVLNFEAPPPPAPTPAPAPVAAPPPPPATIDAPSIFATPAAAPPVSTLADPVPTPVSLGPKAGSALLKKKNRNVAAFEKMLRRIAARRLELASEYPSS